MRGWMKVVAWGLVIVAGGFLLHVVYLKTHHRHSWQAALAAHPMPRLFDQAAVAAVGGQDDQQAATAARLMDQWWRTHGTASHDHGFATWVKATLPGPPTPAARRADATALAQVAASRTDGGRTAAQWLERFGAKDEWRLLEKQGSTRLPKAQAKRRMREFDRMLRMSADVSTTLDKRYRQPAPYVVDTALRPDTSAPRGKDGCPCSYPAAPAAASAAAGAFLGYLHPQQAAQYRNLEHQVAYARVYMGTHLPSDVRAGSLLGDMVADYFLVTRGQASPAAATAALSRG